MGELLTMEISRKVVVITGAASGIGRAFAAKFADCNTSKVVLADSDTRAVRRVCYLISLPYKRVQMIW